MFYDTVVLVRFDSVWIGFADVDVRFGLGGYSWRGRLYRAGSVGHREWVGGRAGGRGGLVKCLRLMESKFKQAQ